MAVLLARADQQFPHRYGDCSWRNEDREMARKQAVNKAQIVRAYLNAHPAAMTKEIVAALDTQGIKITAGYVATIKAKLYETVSLPTKVKPPDPLTLDQFKKVAQAMRIIRLRERIGNLHQRRQQGNVD